MNRDQLNQLIAEKVGWKIESYGPAHHPSLYWRLRTPDGTVRCDGCTGEAWSRTAFSAMVPNFCASLDACHEAEKVLTEDEKKGFIHLLCSITNSHAYDRVFKPVFATALQRAIALGLTWGLITADQAEALGREEG